MDIESKQNLISTGSIVVVATIGSFVASSAYVLGLSIGLHQPVYEFFELKDYLEVTPVWLLTYSYLRPDHRIRDAFPPPNYLH
jgi:hypothetical protein